MRKLLLGSFFFGKVFKNLLQMYLLLPSIPAEFKSMSSYTSDLLTQEKNEELSEPNSNVSASGTMIHNEKEEIIQPQDDERQISESSSHEPEEVMASSGHPSNEEHTSEDVAKSIPTECSETVSLEPEPGTEVLNDPVRNALSS